VTETPLSPLITKQRLCDQAWSILKSSYFTSLELSEIEKQTTGIVDQATDSGVVSEDESEVNVVVNSLELSPGNTFEGDTPELMTTVQLNELPPHKLDLYNRVSSYNNYFSNHEPSPLPSLSRIPYRRLQ